MTIGAWFAFAFFSLVILVSGLMIGFQFDGKIAVVVSTIISLTLCGVLLLGMRWYYGNTAAGARALKSQKSNFENGIERTVRVYDVQGEVIQEYSGRFDVSYDDNRILFDDENGKRHVIYYPTGTVIIDEN